MRRADVAWRIEEGMNRPGASPSDSVMMAPCGHEPGSQGDPLAPDPALFRLLVENATDVLVLADATLRRQYVSPACLSVMGYTQEELLGRTPANLVHPDDLVRVMAVFDRLSVEHPTATSGWRLICPDGAHRWMETTYRRLPDGKLVGVVRDIQRRKEIEERLEEALLRVERLAMRDSLTGLANRRCFLDAVDQRIARGPATAPWGVLIIDLDRFKSVNDQYGHAAGDLVLIEIAGRLRHITGPDAMIARLGGDEFALLLDIASVSAASGLAEAIIAAVRMPIDIGPAAVVLGSSIGAALGPQDGADTGATLRRADTAMYEAKRAACTGYRVFAAGEG